MIEKTCCVTGHRDIPAEKVEYVKTRLGQELERAVAEGFTTFLSGFASGADLLFAELVIKQRKKHPHLLLKAIIPYRGRLKSPNPLFQACLSGCNGIHIQQEEYSGDCFRCRNRFLVAESSRVIAVYDGRVQGGTLSTLRYARRMKREVCIIRL